MENNIKISQKIMFLMILVLVGIAEVEATEREGVIILFNEDIFSVEYFIDTNGDDIENSSILFNLRFDGDPWTSNGDRLKRYLRVGTVIIYDDGGVNNQWKIDGNRILGFINTNGQYVYLDQMFDLNLIQRYFPYLWRKIQSEGRNSR